MTYLAYLTLLSLYKVGLKTAGTSAQSMFTLKAMINLTNL